MSVPDEVDLSGGRKQVYRFVERHGPVEPSVVAESVGVDRPVALDEPVDLLATAGEVDLVGDRH